METAFTDQDVKQFEEDFKIQMLSSTPYFVQANDHVECSNKILKDLLRKTFKKKLRSWHQILQQILWAYNTSKRVSIGTNPYTLTYGHDAILLMEIVVHSMRTVFQEKISVEEFNEAIILELKNVEVARLWALDVMKANK